MIFRNHFFIQNCILVHLFYQYSSNASYCLSKSSNFLLIWGSISRSSEPPHVWGAQGTARSLDPWLVGEIFIVCIGPYKYHLVLWVRKEIDALDKFNKHCVITPITIVDLPGPQTLLQIHEYYVLLMFYLLEYMMRDYVRKTIYC